MADRMWEHQFELDPVVIRIDAREVGVLARHLANTVPAVHDEVAGAVREFGDAVYAEARANLSGDADADLALARRYRKQETRDKHRAAYIARRGLVPSRDAVLNVRTGRLRGALRHRHFRAELASEVSNDVFYGTLWEQGFFLKPWGRPPGIYMRRPWMQPAFEKVGGEAEFTQAVDDAVTRGIWRAGIRGV